MEILWETEKNRLVHERTCETNKQRNQSFLILSKKEDWIDRRNTSGVLHVLEASGQPCLSVSLNCLNQIHAALQLISANQHDFLFISSIPIREEEQDG